MTLMSVTSRIVRIVSGRVTRVIRCQALAPSTSVASSISRGMAWIAPMNRIIPKPMTFQVTEPMIAHVERSASTPSHRTGSSMSPMSSRNRLTSPNSGLNSQYHSRLETPRPMTTGMKIIVRVTRWSGCSGP